MRYQSFLPWIFVICLTMMVSVLVLMAECSAKQAGDGGMTVKYLRCEYKTNPLGIDVTAPRLSWELQSSERGVSQKAYRILAASTKEKLARDEGDLWDSGQKAGTLSDGVTYEGRVPGSGGECWWKVRVWPAEGKESNWSEAGYWSRGLLKAEDWKGQWIGYNTRDTELCRRNLPERCRALEGCWWVWYPEGEPGKKAPAGERYFRYRFSIPRKKAIRQGMMYIAADDKGYLYINGKPQNVISVYNLLSAIDVTAALQEGENLIAVSAENTGKEENPAGLIGKLVIEFSDGAKQYVPVDCNWKCSKKEDALGYSPEFNDCIWETVRRSVRYGEAPWEKYKLVLPPPAYLRKEFTVAKPVRRATAYASALGIYELRINGEKVGNDYFSPGWTDYKKRVYYQTYDITNLLHEGANAVGAMAADGWYSDYIGWDWKRDHYGERAWFLGQIQIEYQDGSTETIGTDGSWRASTGPLRQASFLMGETYDAQEEMAGWDRSGFAAGNWKMAEVSPAKEILIQAHPGMPVQAVGEIRPIGATEPQKGRYVFDMGRNFAGFVRLRIDGAAGQTIQLRFAERLNPDGTFYIENLRGAMATDTYICRGGGDEVWQPRFTFHGFQYVEVTGLRKKPNLDLITGVELSSATPVSGMFVCSDATANQLYKNICQTQRMNFIDVPTDCPQRDERLGWTGDAQIYIATACLNSDAQAFYTKWLRDLNDGQREDGQYPCIAPVISGHDDGGPAWQEAGVVCPWTLYQAYGDRRILETYYPAMAKFVEFCRNRCTEEFLPPEKFHCYGDWLQIQADTPKDVIFMAYFGLSARIMTQAAEALGKTDDVRMYQELFERIKQSFNKAYVAEDGRIKGDTQCVYVLALANDLLEPALREKALRYLVEDIEGRDGHLSTGFVGTKDLMLVLSRFGRNDVAYRLFHNDTFPSWGFSIRNGATSIWERWDGWTPEKGFQNPHMNSFAHYSFGAVGQWMFENIGGIRSEGPAYRRIVIKPEPGGTLSFAKTRYRSIQGEIVSEWKIEKDAFSLKTVIPANTTATV